jgi:hypothetical protein
VHNLGFARFPGLEADLGLDGVELSGGLVDQTPQAAEDLHDLIWARG